MKSGESIQEVVEPDCTDQSLFLWENSQKLPYVAAFGDNP